MRSFLVGSVIGLAALLAFSSAVVAQDKPGSKESLYNGNRLKPTWPAGGPAPYRDVSGSWGGNLTPERGDLR